MDRRWSRFLLSIVLAAHLPIVNTEEEQWASQPSRSEEVHSRQKRILWVTNDGRLALPPGTSLMMSTTLSMPFVRHPPPGFLANISLGFPFTIDFDKLGLTDNENPYGALPALDRSFGRAAGSLVADYLGQYLERRRGKRDLPAVPHQLESAILDRIHGGERVMLYSFAEDLLSQFGWAGRDCLLRAICEIHTHPLTNFGFLGEIIKLFFTPSISPYAHLMPEHTAAQRAGQKRGECFAYYRACPSSLFLPADNKYSKEAEEDHRRQSDSENEINRAM